MSIRKKNLETFRIFLLLVNTFPATPDISIFS